MKPKFNPVDDTEKRLQVFEDLEKGISLDNTYANASDNCDICKRSFSSRRFMVDGNRPKLGVEFACMCSICFFKEGAGIGWGKGQLYTKMDDGHMVDDWWISSKRKKPVR